jgi:hypothetical protein
MDFRDGCFFFLGIRLFALHPKGDVSTITKVFLYQQQRIAAYIPQLLSSIFFLWFA